MSGYTVTTSAELMENYLQADIPEPQDTFTALQTDGRHVAAVLGRHRRCLVSDEGGAGCGQRVARDDLSAAQIRSDFRQPAKVTKPSAPPRPVVPAGGGRADPAGMVVDDGTNDHLYLSLGNSDADTGWAQQPVWAPAPFNAKDGNGTRRTPGPFQIVNVLISEATDGSTSSSTCSAGPDGSSPRFWIASQPPGAGGALQRCPIDLEATSIRPLEASASRPTESTASTRWARSPPRAQLIYTPCT